MTNKLNKSIIKRFKKIKNGFKYKHSSNKHFLTKKTSSHKLRLKGTHLLNPIFKKKYKLYL